MKLPTKTVTGANPAARLSSFDADPGLFSGKRRLIRLIVTNPKPGEVAVGDVSITSEGATAHSDLVCPVGTVTEHELQWPPKPGYWAYEVGNEIPKYPAIFAASGSPVVLVGSEEA